MLVGLVTSVFLTQNAFYASVVERAEVQDNLRSITQLIGSETRGVAPGGMLVADSLRFAFRVPMRVAGVCDPKGPGDARVHIPGLAQMVTTDMAGYAIHDGLGNWDFRASTWVALLKDSGPANPQQCANRGADTSGIASEFVNLNVTDPITLGDVLMIFREVEFSVGTSIMDPPKKALFRAPLGGWPVELATGLTGVTHFQYRLGTPVYQTSVPPASLPLVDGIRIVAVSKSQRTATGGYTYGWTVDIPLKNSR